jgi:hypothetical protein
MLKSIINTFFWIIIFVCILSLTSIGNSPSLGSTQGAASYRGSSSPLGSTQGVASYSSSSSPLGSTGGLAIYGGGNGGGQNIAPLNVTVKSNKARVLRGNDFEVGYLIYFEKYDLETSRIKLTYPSQFINIRLTNKDLMDDPEKGSKTIPLKTKKIKPENSPIEIGYIALVPLNATNNETYNLSDYIIDYKNHCNKNFNEIKVINNLPNITFTLGGDCTKKKEDYYTCFNQSNISLTYNIIDEESNGISCDISANDSRNWSYFSNDYSETIHYDLAHTGLFEFNLSAEDKDGGRRHYSLYLDVDKETKEENFSDNYPKMILFLTIVIIVIFYIIRRKLTKFPISEIMEISKRVLIALGIGSIPVAYYFKILNFDYMMFVYIIVFAFVMIFLELDFDFRQYQDGNKCNNGKYVSNSLWYRLWYSIKQNSLIFIAISGMLAAALIVSWLLPLGFLKQDAGILQSYVFYYYTALIQLFGTILTIVSMFTIWYLQEGKISKDNVGIVKLKLEDFMFLHIVVIVISLGGLALGEVPHLNIGHKVLLSYASIASILAFQTTMMLIIPSMVALYRMTCWFMNPNLREESPTFMDYIFK